ncbi:MAG: CpsB/CapC family capsule biosynthesis tyrosine phosphatase [Tepidisphaeraceae bacterium]
MTGRIDVHSHLLPGVDDGCKTVEESIACARELVANGYTHAFCTPHIWPSYPNITKRTVPQWTANLQQAYADAGVPLTLFPGGEMNLHAAVTQMTADYVITMGMGGRYMLVDMWFDKLPDFFDGAIRWLQGMGLTVILAHPERMRAVQDDPSLADRFTEMGILLQGNLQCFSDRPEADTRRVVEQYLREGRYFMLGSDTHNPQSMGVRMNGLRRAIELAGETTIAKLTIENPRKLLPL